jgi:LPXTG-site transpeptidase (sortase) family protein
MRLKTLPGRTKLIVVFMGFALSAAFLFCFIQQKSNLPAENSVALPIQEQTNAGLPVRLKIPEINIDASLSPVGLTSDGAMNKPKGPDDVVWYELGPRPGENGSAVMAGHYGTWKTGKGSVFDNLHKLRPGDKLYVEDDKGAAISFVVRESRRYDPKADASDVFSSNDGKAHLNLITCEGAWNKVSKSYPNRLVVFADKE